MRLFKGFKDLVLRGNLVDLAVAVVIGAAFSTVIQAFVKDLITPLIGIFVGFSFPSWSFTVNKSIFQVGDFINAFISFMIRSEEHTSELQSRENLVCRLLLEK